MDKQAKAPWVTWKHRGVRYLAIRKPEGDVIVDQKGNYYGAWAGGPDKPYGYKEFQRRQKLFPCSPERGCWGKVSARYSIDARNCEISAADRV